MIHLQPTKLPLQLFICVTPCSFCLVVCFFKCGLMNIYSAHPILLTVLQTFNLNPELVFWWHLGSSTNKADSEKCLSIK